MAGRKGKPNYNNQVIQTGQTKTERIEFRCTAELKATLDWLREHSAICKDKSVSWIIEYALTRFYNDKLQHMYLMEVLDMKDTDFLARTGYEPK